MMMLGSQMPAGYGRDGHEQKCRHGDIYQWQRCLAFRNEEIDIFDAH